MSISLKVKTKQEWVIGQGRCNELLDYYEVYRAKELIYRFKDKDCFESNNPSLLFAMHEQKLIFEIVEKLTKTVFSLNKNCIFHSWGITWIISRKGHRPTINVAYDLEVIKEIDDAQNEDYIFKNICISTKIKEKSYGDMRDFFQSTCNLTLNLKKGLDSLIVSESKPRAKLKNLKESWACKTSNGGGCYIYIGLF